MKGDGADQGNDGGSPIKASVIVVSYNCRDYLLKCLESMFNRTRIRDVEWIVVDNASTDGTPKEVERRYPQVRLIKNERNEGFARANNQGVLCARGEYLFLVNPDVEFLDDCIGNLCRFMDDNPGVGLCGPRILNADGTVQHSCRKLPTLWNNLCFALGLHRLFPRSSWFSNELMSYFDHGSRREVEALSGCFLAVRRAAIQGAGPLDERFFMYSEDVDLCRRLRDRGWKIVFNPETEAVHHGGKSSEKVSVPSAVQQERAILQYWEKHHTRLETTLILGILLMRHVLRFLKAGLIYILGNRQKASGILAKDAACIKSALTVKMRAGKTAPADR